MYQVFAFIILDWTLISLFFCFSFFGLVWDFIYLLNDVQVVKHEGWDRLYGGLTPSLVGTAASQVSPFELFSGLLLTCACTYSQYLAGYVLCLPTETSMVKKKWNYDIQMGVGNINCLNIWLLILFWNWNAFHTDIL